MGVSATGTVITTSITNTPAVVVDSWALATYRSAKYILQVTCTASTYNASTGAGNNVNTYQVSEILVIQDGTTATMTEYAAVKTNSDIATFTVDINSGNCRLLAIATNSTDTITVKLYKTLLTV